MESLQDKCSKQLSKQVKFIYQNTNLLQFLQIMENHAKNVRLEGRFFVRKQLEQSYALAYDYPVFTKLLIPTVQILDETTSGKIYKFRWDCPNNLEFWAEATINENNPEKSSMKGRNVPLDVKITSITEDGVISIRWGF